MIDSEPAAVDPPYLVPDYGSTSLRAPRRALVLLPHSLGELTGPVYGHSRVGPDDWDLTRQHEGAPLGERIIVHGKVLDRDGRPVSRSLIEVWQANSAGRYRHDRDDSAMPLDPNFTGSGRAMTDDEGRYRFVTVKPAAYPWKNHRNAWRPAHIHFSLFGPAFVSRLVTQMYFPGDPLFAYDPIFRSVPEYARSRLVAGLDMDEAIPGISLAFRFDIVLRGRDATPMEG